MNQLSQYHTHLLLYAYISHSSYRVVKKTLIALLIRTYNRNRAKMKTRKMDSFGSTVQRYKVIVIPCLFKSTKFFPLKKKSHQSLVTYRNFTTIVQIDQTVWFGLVRTSTRFTIPLNSPTPNHTIAQNQFVKLSSPCMMPTEGEGIYTVITVWT